MQIEKHKNISLIQTINKISVIKP